MSEDPFTDGCAYIEGEYFPIAEACIPIMDSGFTRSDVTYDVVAVWNGKFFRLTDHLNRFERGCRRAGHHDPTSGDRIRSVGGRLSASARAAIVCPLIAPPLARPIRDRRCAATPSR